MSAAEACTVCGRHPWTGHKLDCPNRLASPPDDGDERIAAWETLVKHPFFADCFRDGVLLDHMTAKLDALSSPPADDVREAIAKAVWAADAPTLDYERKFPSETDELHFGDDAWRYYLGIADRLVSAGISVGNALTAATEVRLRGTDTAVRMLPASSTAETYVRPRGNVTDTEPTDAQVLAGLNAELPKKSAAPSLDFYGGDNVARMRRVLREAAREARS